jgi:hypothetical protein
MVDMMQRKRVYTIFNEAQKELRVQTMKSPTKGEEDFFFHCEHFGFGCADDF